MPSARTRAALRPMRAWLRIIVRRSPRSPPAITYAGSEHVALERLAPTADLELYRYVLRDQHGAALGFCEFDWEAFPHIELKNFGLIPAAQGRGLGPWLHTDTWDHPAAKHVYERAGFRVYDVRDERADAL